MHAAWGGQRAVHMLKQEPVARHITASEALQGMRPGRPSQQAPCQAYLSLLLLLYSGSCCADVQGKRIDNTSVRDEPYEFVLGGEQVRTQGM